MKKKATYVQSKLAIYFINLFCPPQETKSKKDKNNVCLLEQGVYFRKQELSEAQDSFKYYVDQLNMI